MNSDIEILLTKYERRLAEAKQSLEDELRHGREGEEELNGHLFTAYNIAKLMRGKQAERLDFLK